ncbi:MAG: DegT/DnrJ/EryC1/StrS family aminotransferase [Actinomycetales bacterium]|nr:DegT/DnrJ/EryC1/StrS family aminotransferase [Actinomycetales bacterium]
MPEVPVTVPFLDLRVPAEEQAELLAVVTRVLNHGRLVMGPEVSAFEERVARACNRVHAVGVGSGTDALWLGLRALGIGPGDEVITTPLSWVASSNAIVLTGAEPVFADIGDDLNLDPASIPALITSRTRAILFVDFTGHMADAAALEAVAANHGLLLVEDGSQAFGARVDGRPCGSVGDLSGISHNPMKVLGALGEAGSVLTNDGEVRERLTTLRYAGTPDRQTCIEPSLNGRLDTLQAAVLLARLDRVSDAVTARRAHAIRYDAGLREPVATPMRSPRFDDVFYTYTVQCPRRDELRSHLAESGIETKIQHPQLIPQQPAFTDFRRRCPRAEHLVTRILSLPMSERLSTDQVDTVIDAVNTFYR